ncbi:MAG: DUF7594 domain-containing protein, partial [Gammaproteobacteria bacterium]
MVGLALMAGMLQPAFATTTTLTAESDSFVLADSPSTNRGSSTLLRINDDVKRTYFRFNLSGLPAGESVTSATLRVFATTVPKCSLGAEVLRAANETWGESTITWSNQPGTTGSAVANVASWVANIYVSFGVTSAVSGTGTVSFVLRHPPGCTPTGDATFQSREGSNRPQLVVDTVPGAAPQCSDGADNDGDTKIDFPNDPGCTDANDNDETDLPQCSDLVDNDGDTKIDFPNDPGCTDANDNDETNPPQCSDLVDNDGDTKIDFPNDPGCTDANDNDETDSPVGAWGPVQALSDRPVHSVVLPTSKVLWWPSEDNAEIWDPSMYPSDASVTPAGTAGYNIFCAGHSLIADGRVLVTGGHISGDRGLNNASYYDPSTDTWEQLADMNAGRWYPTNVTLANGDVLVMSGRTEAPTLTINLVPQVWQVQSNSWRTLSMAPSSQPLYPAAFLAPNGKVFVAIKQSLYLDTDTGAWTTVATRIVSDRDNYGSAAMYDNGKVIYTGGTLTPTATAEVIDLNAATPAWTSVAPMPQKRRQHNATLLPDGTLLVTGGSSSKGQNTNDGPKPAINWNPATNTWTTWATESRYRGYHSEALLLPDGRV